MKGQWLPQKLRRLAGRNGRGSKSLSAIARKYAGIAKDSNSEKESLAKYKSANALLTDLSNVLNGKRNTKSLIHILETEWSLSISEIREIFAEHRERVSAGNLFSEEELTGWQKLQTAKRMALRTGKDTETVFAEHNAFRRQAGLL